MLHINEFKELLHPASIFAAYTWPSSDLPKGEFIGRSGNALLMKTEDGYAVISAPKGETQLSIELPQVDLAWAF